MYLDPKEVKSIMHIKSRNFHYEASFNEEAHDLEAVIIDGFTFFDKFGNDLLFFAGLPSFSKNNYSYFSIVLIIVSIITLCSFLWKEKTFEYVLMPSLFFIPLLSSYILSILVSPIFVGRNLYVASFSYLVGIALLVALLIDKGGMKKIVLSGFILSIFIYVLFIKFPFLHYVDPPYEIEVLIDRVLDKSQEKKKVIVFDHASQFEVLFHYQLLLNKEKMNDVSIISLSSFETLLNDVNIDLFKKMYYEYYFISFNQNTDQFKKLVRSLECRLKEVKFTYTTLSYCHY